MFIKLAQRRLPARSRGGLATRFFLGKATDSPLFECERLEGNSPQTIRLYALYVKAVRS